MRVKPMTFCKLCWQVLQVVGFPLFYTNLFSVILSYSDPDVPNEMQEENKIQYKFQVYQRDAWLADAKTTTYKAVVSNIVWITNVT